MVRTSLYLAGKDTIQPIISSIIKNYFKELPADIPIKSSLQLLKYRFENYPTYKITWYLVIRIIHVQIYNSILSYSFNVLLHFYLIVFLDKEFLFNSFSFIIFNMSSHCFHASIVSTEKLAVYLIEVPCCWWVVSLSLLSRFFSLSWAFNNLIIMCLAVSLFEFILLESIIYMDLLQYIFSKQQIKTKQNHFRQNLRKDEDVGKGRKGQITVFDASTFRILFPLSVFYLFIYLFLSVFYLIW